MNFNGLNKIVLGGVLGGAALMVTACGGSEGGDETSAAVDVSPEIAAVIEARQANFKTFGKSMKAISDAAKAGDPTTPEALAAIDDLEALAPELASWFPEGSGPETGIKMEALAAIWEQPDVFVEKVAAFEAAVVTLAAAGDAADPAAIGAGLGGVGGTCKGCHETFRLDD